MSAETRPLFGVAGNPPNFWNSSFRDERLNAPEWLRTIGLDALEIQCTRGVRMSEERAAAFRSKAERFGITLTIHGPYYISLGSTDEAKIANSLNELKKCVALAQRLGSTRVIFHPGPITFERTQSLRIAIRALRDFERQCDLRAVRLYPEIAGHIASLGSLEEILAICSEVRSASPCLDLAHLHARTGGSLRTRADLEIVFDAIERELGADAMLQLHMHMYPIEWGSKGEIRHRAFDDLCSKPSQLMLLEQNTWAEEHYLPRYEPLMELLVERKLHPLIICEAKDTQDVGALEMSRYWHSLQVPTSRNMAAS